MIIDLSTINFVGGGGESSAPAGKVETVEVNIEMNGVENPTLNEGFSAFGEVTVNSDNVTNSSALLFTQLNYDEELNTELNAKYNADIQYSKELLDKWNNGQISNFQNDSKLVYCPKVDTSNVTNMWYMFNNCSSLTSIPQLNTQNVTDMNYMFEGCSKLLFIPQLNTSNVTTMSGMFNNCKSLTSIPQLDTSNVTNMFAIIKYCEKLTSIPLLNTQNVTNMGSMFHNCKSLQSIPQLNTSNVTDMGSMFDGCSSLTSIPLFDTSNVTTMRYMFNNCSSLITIPLLNTQNVTDMSMMFIDCKSLQSLPLLDCNKVTNIGTFFGYSNITTLTELGGFKDLKIDWNDNYSLAMCSNLTYQSVMNVLNNLYDFRANGDNTTTRTIKLNSNSYNLLSADDIAMANGKGWNVTK